MRSRVAGRDVYNGPLIYRRDITWSILIFITIATLVFIFGVTFAFSSSTESVPLVRASTPAAASPAPYLVMHPNSNPATLKSVSYYGWDGVTAFDLLRQNAAITIGKQPHQLDIKSINGRVADHSKGEYWMLYVNAIPRLDSETYVTKNTDYLVWVLIKS